MSSPDGASVTLGGPSRAVGGAILLIALHGLRDQFLELSRASASLAAVLVALISFRLVFRHQLSDCVFGVAYLLVFTIFHLGVPLVFATGSSPSDFGSPYINLWLQSPHYDAAVLYASSATLAVATGIATAQWLRQQGNRSIPVQKVDGDIRRLQGVGALAVAGGVALWFYVVISNGGLEILAGRYEDLLEVGRSQRLEYIYLSIGIGLALASVGPQRRRNARIARAAFIVFALAGLPLGLRGEVLVPAACAWAIRIKQGAPYTRRRIGATILAVLVTISFVREFRLHGLSEIGEVDVSYVNPIYAFDELGRSLRPLVEVMAWNDEGDQPLRGGSYWAPIERAAATFLPFIDRPPARADPRILNVQISQRVGPIGFSPVAEGYTNFRALGVVLAPFVIGFIVGLLDAMRRSIRQLAMAGVILVPLVLNIRNSFVFVPLHIVIGAAVVVAATAPTGRRATRRRRGRPAQRTATMTPA